EPQRGVDGGGTVGNADAVRPDRGGCNGEGGLDLVALSEIAGDRSPLMSRARIPQPLRTETELHFPRRFAHCRRPQRLMHVTFEVDHILPEKGNRFVSPGLAPAPAGGIGTFTGVRIELSVEPSVRAQHSTLNARQCSIPNSCIRRWIASIAWRKGVS